MSEMRILFVSNFFPPFELGGYEQWCAEVAARLKVRGHDIKILTSNYGVRSGYQEDTSRISRTLHLQSDISYYRPLDFLLKHDSQEKNNIHILCKEIDQFHPDVIMFWGMWHLTHKLPYWAEQWMPDKVAYFISNYWPMDTDAHNAYWNLPANHSIMEPLKSLLRSFALMKLRVENYPPQLEFRKAVCCSQYVRDTLVKNGNLPVKAGVLYGGIDPGPFLKYSKIKKVNQDGQTHRLRLLYFGRLIHDKGVHTSIKAIGLLNQRGLANDIDLTILGNGHPSYEAKLRQLVTELGIEEHIVFVNQVHRDDIPNWLSKFDVFLFTSIWPEPMARSVMEAMAAGLLVIGTEVGGQVEMLSSGTNSLTFKPEDAETLSNHIVRVRNNYSLMINLALEGQKLVLEKFTLERMVSEIEHYLSKIVQSA